jgi:hypothetical protein
METSRTKVLGRALLPSCFCGFLLAAVALKTFYFMETETIAVGRFAISPWLQIIAVQFELLLIFLFIAGISPLAVWRAAAALFAVFGIFSLARAVAGYDSCGCFGRVKVNPWWTFALDAGIVTMLLINRREFVERRPVLAGSRRFVACGVGCVLLSAVSLVVMARTAPASLSDGVSTLENRRLVILEAVKWIGREFPLRDALTPPVDLSAGNWTVLIYHHDCPKCQEVLPQYQRLVKEYGTSDESGHVLCLEVPPFGERVEYDGPARYARLSDDREWFVETPVEIQLTNGKVTLASTELPSVASGL